MELSIIVMIISVVLFCGAIGALIQSAFDLVYIHQLEDENQSLRDEIAVIQELTPYAHESTEELMLEALSRRHYN